MLLTVYAPSRSELIEKRITTGKAGIMLNLARNIRGIEKGIAS